MYSVPSLECCQVDTAENSRYIASYATVDLSLRDSQVEQRLKPLMKSISRSRYSPTSPFTRSFNSGSSAIAQGIELEFKESIAPALGMSYGGKIAILPGQSAPEEFGTLVHEPSHLCSVCIYVA
jgi:hypothetical protein